MARGDFFKEEVIFSSFCASLCLSLSLLHYLSIYLSFSFFRRRVVPNLGKEEASWKALGVLIDLSDSVVFGVAFFDAFPAGCHDVQLFFLFSVLCLFLLLLLCFLFYILHRIFLLLSFFFFLFLTLCFGGRISLLEDVSFSSSSEC